MSKDTWLNWKFKIRSWLGQYSSFLFLKNVLGTDKENICTPDTEIVIEGFPRSANSFAVWAFRMSQQRAVKIAHHLHVPAQVIYAVKHRIPVLVLLRDPSDAVIALKIRYPWISLKVALHSYRLFYKSIQPYLGNIVVATFDEVVTDYGKVIRAVNRKFGTHFGVFEHSSENVADVFRHIEERAKQLTGLEQVDGFAAFPSAKKESVKQELKKSLNEVSIRALVEQCKEIYSATLKMREQISD